MSNQKSKEIKGIDLIRLKKIMKNPIKQQKKAMIKCKTLSDVAKLFPYKKSIEGWAIFLKAYYPVFLFACAGEKRPKDHLLVKWAEKMGQKCLFRKCEIKIL